MPLVRYRREAFKFYVVITDLKYNFLTALSGFVNGVNDLNDLRDLMRRAYTLSAAVTAINEMTEFFLEPVPRFGNLWL